jgi:hypothetical protein
MVTIGGYDAPNKCKDAPIYTLDVHDSNSNWQCAPWRLPLSGGWWSGIATLWHS